MKEIKIEDIEANNGEMRVWKEHAFLGSLFGVEKGINRGNICRDFSETRAIARERTGTHPTRPTRSIYRARKTVNFIVGK